MEISRHTVVSLAYELKTENGDVVDKVESQEPFSFIHGIGHTLPKFDENLEGLQMGETFQFELNPEEAFGEFSEENILDIPKGVFEDAPEDVLQVGKVVPMQDNEGNQFEGEIKEIKDENVVMDFNHPLAGQKLTFSGEVVGVREASEDEIQNQKVKEGEEK